MDQFYNIVAMSQVKTILPEKLKSHKILTEAQRFLRIVDRTYMAQRLGVSESMISKWISGSKPLNLPRSIQILHEVKEYYRTMRKDASSNFDAVDQHLAEIEALQYGKVIL